MKASPCTSLTCLALNLREDGEPTPVRCPRCGGDTLLGPPTPTPLAALRESVARRVFVDGDPDA